jgi:hypothetical protein
MNMIVNVTCVVKRDAPATVEDSSRARVFQNRQRSAISSDTHTRTSFTAYLEKFRASWPKLEKHRLPIALAVNIVTFQDKEIPLRWGV